MNLNFFKHQHQVQGLTIFLIQKQKQALNSINVKKIALKNNLKTNKKIICPPALITLLDISNNPIIIVVIPWGSRLIKTTQKMLRNQVQELTKQQENMITEKEGTWVEKLNRKRNRISQWIISIDMTQISIQQLDSLLNSVSLKEASKTVNKTQHLQANFTSQQKAKSQDITILWGHQNVSLS